MQHRLTNLGIKVMTEGLRAFVVPALVFSLILPAIPAHSAGGGPKPTGGPVSIGALMQLSGFKNMVMTIAMVNQAMRVAADNPMDEWRRTNVRIAMSMMPGAIAGMAQEFMKGKLGNDDLPIVQGILGGFVDKNAGDAYQKFMRDPSARNIPKVGAGFPNVTPPPLPKVAGTALASDSKGQSASGGAVVGGIGKAQVDRPPSREMVSLSQRLDAKPEAQGTAKTQSTTFDDGASKASASDASGGSIVGGGKVAVDAAPQGFSGGSQSYGAASPGNREVATGSAQGGQASPTQQGAPALPYVGSETVLKASRELSSIEQHSQSSETRLSIVRGGKKEEGGDNEFFDNFEKQTKKKVQPRKQQRRPTTRPTSSLGPTKFFKFLALGYEALLPAAHAEEEEGKREGGQAAAILMALAAIMAAVAPMVVASIQANADKDIAKTNANAQIKMTEITADTQKQANAIAQNVALTQSATAQGVAAMNNAGVTDRLQLQLAELRSARTDARTAEEERRKLDQEYNGQRLALAEKQSKQNLDLAKETLAAQLSEAGLRSGFSSSTNSGLETTKTASSGASNQNPVTNGSRLSGSNSNSTAAAGGSSGLAQRTSSSTSTFTPRANGPSLNVGAKTSASFDDNAKGAAVASNSGATGSSSLNLGSATGGARGFDEGFAADTGVDDKKAAADCAEIRKKDSKKGDECFAAARASSRSATRGLRSPAPASKRLLTGLTASNTGRGMAARLSQLTATAPTNPNVAGSVSEMRAFVKPASSFGGFLRSQEQPGFATYQQTAGAPHRDLTSSEAAGGTISGGHSAKSANGILNLTQ